MSGSHATHAEPAAPHVVGVAALHVAPAQQPDGHETPSHTQVGTPLTATQRWPESQAGLAPQRQAPAVQRSASTPPQSMHVAPLTPQLDGPEAMHWSPWQQPFGQLVASQAQRPDWQRCPTVQAGPLPHAQPPARQPSASEGSQAKQSPPPVPH
jgi:hypothetical protein